MPDCQIVTEAHSNQKKFLNNTIKQAKIKQNSDKISNSINKQKTMWNVVNKSVNFKTGNLNRHIAELYIDDSKTLKSRDPRLQVEIINNHFVLTPKIIQQEMPCGIEFNGIIIPAPKIINCCMFLAPTTPEEVSNIINSLSESTACDLNFLSTKLIKKFSTELAIPLSIVINESIINGIFPDELKISRVTPVFKSGDKCDPNNYRPIAILPVFSKIFERVIYSRLIDFLTQKKVIDPRQHGFLKNKSTTTAIFDFIDKVLKGLDNSETVLSIFIDLSKAFDCVDHKILLGKLHNYEIRGLPLKLLEFYLKNLNNTCQYALKMVHVNLICLIMK
jgi:hypothetical protein